MILVVCLEGIIHALNRIADKLNHLNGWMRDIHETLDRTEA